FESPHRIERSLGLLNEIWPERRMLVAREVSKLHEEMLRGTAAEILAALAGRARGEITLVIAGA
ncbi:MAG TPA: 16S rRNA (cytidine(1402)-2'-O)-methyltransferase, partial [Chloroflexota bacterium]|nr:16S rRNA (cytidine(1402)-2'-O)-methyltransferase [Chloroflexota bacterium]